MSAAPPPPSAQELAALYAATRAHTESLAAPLSPEDQLLQSMPSASPAKWHRAHTTWFFETFLLGPAGIAPFDPHHGYLFNSYYEALGPRHARPQRGLLSRPSCEEIARYRAAVDARMLELIERCKADELARLSPLLHLGVAHEEQHQELLLTDILHAFSQHPLRPNVLAADARAARREPASQLQFVPFADGLRELGATQTGFAFDNERPRHKRWLDSFALAERLLTVGELKQFIEARGYHTPSLWLAEGWDFIRAHAIEGPMHLRFEGATAIAFDLTGEREAHDSEPLLHISAYEADALARFFGARLPTEAEWEIACATAPGAALRDLFGVAWQWTRSAYEPYPGYAAPPGAIGEYNGKFMINQLVLRGSSDFTPARHSRASYRNFWPADTRFQRTGVRLAKDGGTR